MAGRSRAGGRSSGDNAVRGVPALAGEAPGPSGTVVMKFGGTSVADTARIKAVAQRLVAAREAGNRVVAVLSAMGDTTDALLRLAHEVSPTPVPREVDMLISVGERVSCALAAMAIHDLGHEAISLTGSQAGIVTDTVHAAPRSSTSAPGGSTRRSTRIGSSSSPGSRVSRQPTRSRRRPRRLESDGGRACGGARRRRVRDVHGRRRRVHGGPASRAECAQAARDQLRGDAGDGGVGREGAPATLGRVRTHHGVKLHVRSSFSDAEGTWIREEDERMLEKAIISGVTHSLEESGVSRRWGGALTTVRGALRSGAQRRHHPSDRRGDRLFRAYL